jgi:hypothetical protein
MSNRRLARIVTGLGAAAVVGCGSSGGAPQSGPLVTYVRSGGLVGVFDELRVSRSGAATVRGVASSPLISFRLRAAELERLERDLDTADIGSIPSTRAPACADCFHYRIAAGGDAVEADESRVPPALRPLLGELGRIVDAHMPHVPLPHAGVK